ncbi:MAG: polysaccharide deacetylase family protein [Lachnospiraceae bacterium]|nr:polysaccharide deacetylase family protein [Lachnospiraceae bacterium]
MKEYIKNIRQKIRIFPPRKEGQSGEEYAKQRMLLGLKYGVYALAAFAVLRGVLVTVKANVSVSNSVNGKELPIYCVETDEPKIALSFDAAWGNEDTQKILEILKKHDVRVTFFMTGGWVESYPDDVKAILAAGHDLGNHSENHKNMSQLSDAEKKEELMSVHQKVQELTGYEMFLFRPPYGDYDNAVVNVAKDCGYFTIQWDVDSLDWKDYGVDSIIKTVTEHKHLGNGSIILCHNGAKYTAEALDTLITTLKEKGYTFVPISELVYRDKYHMNHEGRQMKN